jgi:hypothetical protein
VGNAKTGHWYQNSALSPTTGSKPKTGFFKPTGTLVDESSDFGREISHGRHPSTLHKDWNDGQIRYDCILDFPPDRVVLLYESPKYHGLYRASSTR